MLAARLATAVVGIPLLLVVVWLGGPVFWVVAAGAAALAALEAVRLLEGPDASPARDWRAVVLVSAAALVLAAAGGPTVVLAALAAILVVQLAWIVARWGGPDPARAWPGRLVAVLYVGLPLALVVLIRGWAGPPIRLTSGIDLARGAAWVLLSFTVSWGVDSAAFGVGRLLGRRPFAPRLSPKKTWEGTIAGVGAGTLIGLAWSGALSLPAPRALGLGIAISIAAIVGDLAESALKRGAGAKDAGGLLPGHGGLLDRLDSMAFAAVVVFLYGVVFLDMR